MIKTNALPNCLNGKTYKRWDRIRSLGQDTIIASRTDANGTNIQLLLADKGRKRELFYPDGKVMDVIDINGSKRVYKYQRIDNETIKGQMIAGQNNDGRNPLILGAKWILKNLFPEKLVLQINKEHPMSHIYIPKESPEGIPVYSKDVERLHVAEILAKDFEKTTQNMPRTIVLKTVKGTTEPVISESGKGNVKVVKQFGIDSEVLGENIRTVV